MNDDELVEKMCLAAWGAQWPFLMEHLKTKAKADMRAALAVAEPVIRERIIKGNDRMDAHAALEATPQETKNENRS